MLCCVGLIGGLAVGQSLGGSWTYIAPAAGFGIGLVADMKFMKGLHQKNAQPDPAILVKMETEPAYGMKVDETKAPQPVQQLVQQPVQHMVKS